MSNSKRIVLYNPQSWRDRTEPPYARGTEEMPVAMLAIAGLPLGDGYTVEIIDGTRFHPEEAHRRVVEACEGALLYGTTGILGWQVADSLLCTRQVKARHPKLPTIIGGWFASVAPELELATGMYDAVAIGQGEITFQEIVKAVDAGEPLDKINGLALLRDGQVVFTPPRGAVGWDSLPKTPWHLLDPEPYRAPQRLEPGRRGVGKGFGPGMPRFEIPFYSSFGCPLDCTFCCSPQVSSRRWKAMGAARILDEIQELQERWGFDGMRFYDANWGVMEKRVREFADGILERGMKLSSFAYMQADSILRWQPETLDALAACGFYSCLIGAEAGSDETMKRFNKPTRGDDNMNAALALEERGISPLMTYIIGTPGESESSMWATLDQARQIAVRCKHSRPEVWPFRPIPGNQDYDAAVAAGWQPPKTVEEWGLAGDYWNDEAWPGRIPEQVSIARSMFMHYSSLAQCRVRQRDGFWERRARARLARNNFRGARLEARLFHAFQQLAGAGPETGERDFSPA